MIYCILFRISSDKLHNGILVGPDIDKICKNVAFKESLDNCQLEAYRCLIDVMKNVLTPTNLSTAEKKASVNNLMLSLKQLNCNYSPKMHAIHHHFSVLLDRQYSVSDQHGEKMHQTMKVLEDRYDGKSCCSLLSDYIWLFC